MSDDKTQSKPAEETETVEHVVHRGPVTETKAEKSEAKAEKAEKSGTKTKAEKSGSSKSKKTSAQQAESDRKTVREHADSGPKEMPKTQTETKEETDGPIPGKFEDHLATQNSPELGVEAVPGADPELKGLGFDVIPGKFEDHPAVIADAHHTLGAQAVPGEEPPGTKKSAWDVIPNKFEDHPMSQAAPVIGEDAVPSNALVQAADSDEARRSGKNKLRFAGYKQRDVVRMPPALTLVMPDATGKEQEKDGRPVNSGKTLVVKRDEFREFTDSEATWLNSHKLYKFEKA